MADFEGQATRLNHLAFIDPPIHLSRAEILVGEHGEHRLIAAAVGFDIFNQLLVVLVRDELRTGGGEMMCVAHVVPVTVRNQQVSEAQALLLDLREQQRAGVLRRVDDAAVFAVVGDDEVGVGVERPKGGGDDFHLQALKALRMAASIFSGGRMALNSRFTKAWTVKPSTSSSSPRSTL